MTYLNKFHSVLDTVSSRLGIFIAYNGITGKTNGWTGAYGLINKLHLMTKLVPERRISIVCLSIDDFEKLRDPDASFIDILKEKYVQLTTQTCFAITRSLEATEEKEIISNFDRMNI